MTQQHYSLLYPIVNTTANQIITLHQSIKSCSAVCHLCVEYMSDRKLHSRQAYSHQVDLNFNTNWLYLSRVQEEKNKLYLICFAAGIIITTDNKVQI